MIHSEGSKGNILIVDDMPDNLAMLTQMLMELGYRVRPALTGELALNAVQVTLPDIILLDIMMPDIDGYEICQRLKADEKTRDIPVLFISALQEEIDKIKAFEVGGVDYITKPFHLEEVVARVEVHLALRNMQKQLQEQNIRLQQEIDARKKAEEERRQLEAYLRRNQRLEALGTLAGGIAHDFNNILSSMLGYIELILDEKTEDSKEKEYLERVYRVGERATGLVEQILTFSRSQEQQLVPTKISPFISETLKLLRATIPTYIDIRQYMQPDCHLIMADAPQISQVLVNLCINASYAMQENGGTLNVSLEEVNYDGNQESVLGLTPSTYLRLTVSDTGCGMTPDVQERIFEPFFTTKEPGKGTGLGLSVVHGIVKGHHGAITVESQPERGTRFQIFFPILDEQDVQQESQKVEKVRKGEGSILIVEDESDLTALYEFALTKLGYQVTTLNNGHEALEMFHTNPHQFDLVFTDQAMPQMTGEQLSQELLRLRPDLPIILATGYSETISEEKAKALGIRQFLKKPVKILTLVQSIQAILRTSS
jgi:CheY-like chemotaxis protein